MRKERALTEYLDGTLHIEFNMHCLSYLSIGSLADDPAKSIQRIDVVDTSEQPELVVVEELFQVVVVYAVIAEVRRDSSVSCSFIGARIRLFLVWARFRLTALLNPYPQTPSQPDLPALPKWRGSQSRRMLIRDLIILQRPIVVLVVNVLALNIFDAVQVVPHFLTSLKQ